MRVLTTLVKAHCPLWHKSTDLLPGWLEAQERIEQFASERTLWRDLRWTIALLRRSRKYDVVVTGWDRPGLLFAAIQAIFRRSTRVPYVLVYTLWNPPNTRLRRWLRRVEYRAVSRVVTRIITYSQKQTRSYAAEWGLPIEKLACIPYYSTLWEPDYRCETGDYIFAGGDYTRDYRTLIEACRPLGARVVIAARFRHYFEGLEVPPNVRIVTVSPAEFVRLMAGARIVVVPLARGLLQSGGQQTYLSAMAMGKPVVVADDGGAEEYIADGVNGFVVGAGDVVSLRRVLQRLLADDALSAEIGSRARDVAREYTPERFFNSLFDVLTEVTGKCRSS